MNFAIGFISLILLEVSFHVRAQIQSLAPEGDSRYYSTRYDNLDVETFFRSSRLLSNYIDCLLDKKPCPPEGKDLKRK
jgi:Insect pheromone-binding family, A10/OS-D